MLGGETLLGTVVSRDAWLRFRKKQENLYISFELRHHEKNSNLLFQYESFNPVFSWLRLIHHTPICIGSYGFFCENQVPKFLCDSYSLLCASSNELAIPRECSFRDWIVLLTYDWSTYIRLGPHLRSPQCMLIDVDVFLIWSTLCLGPG